MPSVKPFTEEHFGPGLESTTELFFRRCAGAEFDLQKSNGMFSFTPE